MEVLQDPVQNGVGDGGLSHGLVPEVDGQLAGDDRRAQAGPVLNDLEGVGGLVGAERPEQEVVDQQYVDAGPRGHEAGQATVDPGDGQLVEHAAGPQVEGAVAPADGGVGQGAGEEGLADPGRADDGDVVVRADPAAFGQAQDDGTFQVALAAEVEVLDHGIGAQLGGLEVAGHPAVLALGQLPVDEQPEALLEAEAVVGRRVGLFGHTGGHGRQA